MYDINVLCIKQRGNISLQYNDLRLIKLNQRQNSRKGYSDNFEIMGALQGFWYQIYSKEIVEQNDFDSGAWDIVDSKKCSNPDVYYRTLIRDEYDDEFYKDNPSYTAHSIAFVDKKIEENFCELLNKLLTMSSCNRIAVLFKGGLDTPEKVVGSISYSKFVDLLNNNSIYANTVYLLHNNREHYWKSDQ